MSELRIVTACGYLTVALGLVAAGAVGGEAWPQLKYDCGRSGNAADREVAT
ncbi:unnamed protein product, partial [marine sediment metagenome]